MLNYKCSFFNVSWCRDASLWGDKEREQKLPNLARQVLALCTPGKITYFINMYCSQLGDRKRNISPFSWNLDLLRKTKNMVIISIYFLHILYIGLPRWLSSKESTCQAGDVGLIPGSGRSLETEMATHSSILAWKFPWTEEPGGLYSMGLQRVGYDWACKLRQTEARMSRYDLPDITGY